MASSALALASAASKITTVGGVRAAMGAVTLTLSKGYARLAEISTIAGEQDAARSLLDTVNKSASMLYAIYNGDADLQEEEITARHAYLAGRVVFEANDALKAVEDAADEHLWDIASIVEQALAIVGAKVGTGVQAVTNAVIAGGTAFVGAAWETLLIVAAVGAIYFFRAPLARALGKVAS